MLVHINCSDEPGSCSYTFLMSHAITIIWPERGCWCACKQIIQEERSEVCVWRCRRCVTVLLQLLGRWTCVKRCCRCSDCREHVMLNAQSHSLYLLVSVNRFKGTAGLLGEAGGGLLCLQLPLCTFRLSGLCSCLKSFGVFNETQADVTCFSWVLSKPTSSWSLAEWCCVQSCDLFSMFLNWEMHDTVALWPHHKKWL